MRLNNTTASKEMIEMVVNGNLPKEQVLAAKVFRTSNGTEFAIACREDVSAVPKQRMTELSDELFRTVGINKVLAYIPAGCW